MNKHKVEMMEMYLSSEDIKKEELLILCSFDKYCKKNNIYYTLAGGTLLGAIRHKGFIPWDDDIDVVLPRKDYNKFSRLVDETPIASELSVLKPGQENYYYPFIKICNNNTVAKMENNMSSHGIWIDLFPSDNLPESKNASKRLFKRTRFWRAVIIAMTTDLKGCKWETKIIFKIALKGLANLIGKKKVVEILDKTAQQYNSCDTDYMGVSVWGYGVGEKVKKKDFMSSTYVEFEENRFPAPCCWDEYLRGLYGDYMKLPPESSRKTHQLKAWFK